MSKPGSSKDSQPVEKAVETPARPPAAPAIVAGRGARDAPIGVAVSTAPGQPGVVTARRAGELRDMAELTRRIHAAGALVVWDLCHSVGVMEIELDAAAADFAVGCTYKYLNCGPGSPSFIYAARRHHARISQPLSGWWGHAAPFSFETGYRPDAGIRRMLCGTQPILSLRGLNAGLAAIEDVAMADIRAKSLAMTDLFIELVEDSCRANGATIATPRDYDRRGSQVSIVFEGGYAVVQALIARGIIGDFRAPDIMRFGFAPAYLGFADVWRAADAFNDVMATGAWKASGLSTRRAVT